MAERLVLPNEYTNNIILAIDTIKSNCRQRLDITLNDNDIKVFDVNGVFFVLGNPVINKVEYWDDNGRLQVTEIKNIFMEYLDKNLVSKRVDNTINMSYSFAPHLVILYRFMVARIKDGEIVYGG